MIYIVNLMVYLFWGKFYDYRVIDFIMLVMVFVDDVIMVDGWEVKWFVIVVNWMFFGLDIVVYEG